MAILTGRSISEHVSLEIQAWTPECARSDADSYRVVLQRNNLPVYDRSHTVAGWQSGHEEMTAISHAFQRCGDLLDQTTPIAIYSSRFRANGYRPPATLNVNCVWISFSLYAMRRKSKRISDTERDRVIVGGHLELLRHPGSHLNESLNFGLYCPLQAAVIFGEALEREGRSAARQRIELGLSSAPDSEAFLLNAFHPTQFSLTAVRRDRTKWLSKPAHPGLT